MAVTVCSCSSCIGWERVTDYNINWASVYNYNCDHNGWCAPYYCYDHRYGSGTRLGRCIYIFDTSAIPAGSYISQAILKGTVSHWNPGTVGGTIDTVSTQIQLLRATGYPAGGSGQCDGNSAYRFVKDLWALYGQLYVGPEFSNYSFEVLLNDYILTDIVGGGTTPIAMRVSQDILTTPTLYTTGGCRFHPLTNITLEVTHSTVPGIFTIITLAATDVTKTTATLWGEITAGQASKRGFDWGVGTAMDNEWYESGTFGLGQFSHDITGLTEDTEYCFRAKGEESV